VLGFVGWDLEQGHGAVPKDTLERFKVLWLRRYEELLSSGTAADREELSAFGSWFASGAFDDAWAIEQLMGLLRLGIMPDPIHSVVERLASIAPAYPAEVLECLDRILDIDRRGEKIRFFGDHVRKIIIPALKSGNQRVRERATGLVHRLGSFGLREYRDLLTGDD
jgi:hypothetical protein